MYLNAITHKDVFRFVSILLEVQVMADNMLFIGRGETNVHIKFTPSFFFNSEWWFFENWVEKKKRSVPANVTLANRLCKYGIFVLQSVSMRYASKYTHPAQLYRRNLGEGYMSLG